MESTVWAESAIDFFAGTTNIACNTGTELFARDVINKILPHYFPDQTTCKTLGDEIIKLLNEGSGGTLYSICIPKEQFADVAYFSRAGGTPTKKGKYNITHLERYQDGIDLYEDPKIPLCEDRLW